jgi:hypothetical protein
VCTGLSPSAPSSFFIYLFVYFPVLGFELRASP